VQQTHAMLTLDGYLNILLIDIISWIWTTRNNKNIFKT